MESLGILTMKVEATTDRRRALKGIDLAFLMTQIGGYKPATATDFEVPQNHGLGQTIGGTLGIGGIMRGLRTIPVLVDSALDLAEHRANAALLQYVNPMATNCWRRPTGFARSRRWG